MRDAIQDQQRLQRAASPAFLRQAGHTLIIKERWGGGRGGEAMGRVLFFFVCFVDGDAGKNGAEEGEEEEERRVVKFSKIRFFKFLKKIQLFELFLLLAGPPPPFQGL